MGVCISDFRNTSTLVTWGSEQRMSYLLLCFYIRFKRSSFVLFQLDMTDFYDDDYDDLDSDSDEELDGGEGDGDDSGNGES